MLRMVIAVVLLAHGIGHLLGLFPAFGLATTPGWTDRSWLLTNLMGESPARWFGVMLWLAATLGFVLAGLGLLGWLVPAAWWQPLAVGSAVVSLVALALFWHAFPGALNILGARGVDIAVLVALLWAHWSPVVVAGT